MTEHEKATLRTQIIDILCRHSAMVSDQSAPENHQRIIDERSPIFGGGLELDSVSFFESVFAVERVIGTRLRDENMTEAALATVGSFVERVFQTAESVG